MELTRVLLVAFLAACVVSSVLARPHGDQDQLINIASELSHSLQEIVDIMQAEQPSRRRSGRRRRMVQMHIGRAHHMPRYYSRSRFGRFRYRQQRGGRNADISDH